MLIVGGLIAIGLLALLGAVLLSMGEGRSQKASAASVQPAEQHAQVAEPEARAVAQAPEAEATQTMPGYQREALAQTEGVKEVYAGQDTEVNGQIYEVANQLQALRQRTKEIEQRLSQLREVVDHMERDEQPTFVEMPAVMPRARNAS